MVFIFVLSFKRFKSTENDSRKEVDPFKVSPFEVAFKDNKLEYALARLDDLINLARRVKNYKNQLL